MILDGPADIAEGTRVMVLPVENPARAGMREEDWPTTPEGIAAHLKRMDEIESGWLGSDDETAWRAALKAQREADKARFIENSEPLRGKWE